MSNIKIAYIGMTHLGLCSAIAAAAKGFRVIGFDTDLELVEQLRMGILPVIEPGLGDLLHQNHKSLNFINDTSELNSCDVVYVAPDIATNDLGVSDLSTLDVLVDLALAHTSNETTIVILSQVPPGYTRKKLREGKNIYYQVETLIFGRAVERASKPERFIIGCSDPEMPLPNELIEFLSSFDCPILPMRFESAELAKISINCCLVAHISIANTLAELCEKIGADWNEIVPSLKLDKRIGPHAYLTPGLGISGGNLERDLATIIRLSKEYGSEVGTIRAFVDNSRHRRFWVLRELHDTALHARRDIVIGVLGLAYKENTHSIKNSASIELIKYLTPWTLKIYDPVVSAKNIDHPKLVQTSTALDAVKDVDVVLLMTPWSEFKSLKASDLADHMRGRLVLDPFKVLDGTIAKKAGLDWRTLGVA